MNCTLIKTPSGWMEVYNGCGAGNCAAPTPEQEEETVLWQVIQVPCK